VIGESSRNIKDSQYFKCQGYDHVAVQCPYRNLLIKEVDDDEIETVVYEPTGSVTDSDDDFRISNIQRVSLGVHTAVSNEDWRRFSVFHSYIKHEEKNYNR